jgi:hypothetical protein
MATAALPAVVIVKSKLLQQEPVIVALLGKHVTGSI